MNDATPQQHPSTVPRPESKPMLVLGFESSCDETGVALVEFSMPQEGSSAPSLPPLPRLLGHTLHSQISLHQAYGGVVPELASRDHIRRVLPLTEALLAQTGRSLQEVDAIAYTKGPGLAGALLVGAGVACSMALGLGKPVLGVHHLEGHLLSPFLSSDPPTFPFIALLVSGGHTQIMRIDGVGQYQLLGESIDDAAGEAFDKSAKLLGIDYPGGAELSRLAKEGDAAAFAFPRPLLGGAGKTHFDFSFAGLKTAVWTQVGRLPKPLSQQDRANVAASVQEAIVEVLVKKTLRAVQQTGLHRVVIAGGVGANSRLREMLNHECAKRRIRVHYPELAYCTDNGAMIALAAAMRLQSGVEAAHFDYDFSVKPRWPLAVG